MLIWAGLVVVVLVRLVWLIILVPIITACDHTSILVRAWGFIMHLIWAAIGIWLVLGVRFQSILVIVVSGTSFVHIIAYFVVRHFPSLLQGISFLKSSVVGGA